MSNYLVIQQEPWNQSCIHEFWPGAATNRRGWLSDNMTRELPTAHLMKPKNYRIRISLRPCPSQLHSTAFSRQLSVRLLSDIQIQFQQDIVIIRQIY